MTRRRRGWLIAAVVFSVVGLVGSTVAYAAWGGSRGPHTYSGYAGYGPMGPGAYNGRWGTAAASCSSVPTTGTVVTFTARDMGMGGGMMGGTFGGSYGPMTFVPRAATVPAGQVTVVLQNGGTRPHELLVMPLAAGQSVGQRSVGSDDRISETGKIGEVSPACPPNTTIDGTVPGGVSVVTLPLQAGTYEIVCNLPGHYQAGMYATLTVS